MYNAGWNIYSCHSKKLSFVQCCSAQRKAARKSDFFWSIIFVLSFLFVCLFVLLLTDFCNCSFNKNKIQQMCPNYSAFTKLLKIKTKQNQNLQRT